MNVSVWLLFLGVLFLCVALYFLHKWVQDCMDRLIDSHNSVVESCRRILEQVETAINNQADRGAAQGEQLEELQRQLDQQREQLDQLTILYNRVSIGSGWPSQIGQNPITCCQENPHQAISE